MTTDDTMPPNNPRGWLIRACRWMRANPDYAWPAGTFLLGVVLGKVL